MDASIIEKKSHRRSSSGQPAPSRSPGPVYQTESTRSVSLKPRSSSQSGRPQHPSLSRVKGRSNMYTPPHMSPERSWLKDQSPVYSSARTPPRQSRTPESGTPTLVNPSSTLLQDLLKEQRAHRGSRGPAFEEWNDKDPSTPERARVQEDNASTASEKARKVNDVFSAGLRKPKEMGMREMDQYVSKLNKLNFDLKLEIFHRIQQMGALEKKLERMKEMEEQLQRMHKVEEEMEDLRSAEEDNRALRESNEQLRQELDKRDQAVNEAVQLICQLEAKIDPLESGAHLSMSRLVLDGPNANTPKVQPAVEIPERTSSRLKTSSSQPNQQASSDLRQLSKAPSFLRADTQSTATLRSLYAPDNNKSHTACSELTKSGSFHTMNDASELGSPRLSVLSEASELNPFDTPSKWQDDELNIPVRKAPSADSLDSYITPTERKKRDPEQVNQWLQSRPDMSDTIIRRRQNRTSSDASKSVFPTFHGDLCSNKYYGRPRLDTSLFGGVRLPPTPDTMSTAYAAVNNGSNGSIVPQKSPKHGGNQWFAGRQLDRHRSADELTTRRSFDGSDVTDSMQTNYSDTPRANDEAPTIFPFNTVAPKASELLGPGSPNNPAINSFNDLFCHNSKDEAASPTVKRDWTSTKTTALESRSSLTPQDWLAAATRSPQSGEETTNGFRSEQQEAEPNHNALSQTVSHDTQSIDSRTSEPDAPGIPTLDMNALDILEQPVASPLAAIPEPQHCDPESEETRRRFSLRPGFLNKSNGPRRLQSSPTAPGYLDDEDDGAPSPNIPKHRNTGGAQGRPMSQIITDSADLYQPSNVSAHDNTERTSPPKALHQSFMEAREASLSAHPGPATISGRPSTSHSADHKRRSSLGIFGWMKNVGGKRSENANPFVAESFAGSVPVQQKEHRARLVKGGPGPGPGARCNVPRASSPDSMNASRSEMSMFADDTARRPRYMGRRARRG